ncbi:MAG TPA: sensor histidine kinase [Xanthomonadaceae bacterium]|nr:sensor histidine kinase [Xanthomonadaceae bacterium]
MATMQRPREWLPDLCRLPALTAMMVAAEIVVLLLALAPSQEGIWDFPRFYASSLFAQWLALSSALLLCKTRPLLHRLPVWLGALIAWLEPVSMAALGAYLLHEIDTGIGLHMTLPREYQAVFVGGVAALAAVISAAALRYFYVQQQWAEQVQAKADAEVRALQARIRPHFLFNSMNSIASLVRRDPETAERAIEDLADLFRAALGAGQGPASLDEEITLGERYLAIEKLRLGDRLEVEWQRDGDLPLDLQMPRLILQPLLENAIIHGVARLEHGGCIHIGLHVEAGQLLIRIGNPTPRLRGASGNSHAQASIEQRLRHHFGDAARVTIDRRDDYYECTLALPLAAAA